MEHSPDGTANPIGTQFDGITSTVIDLSFFRNAKSIIRKAFYNCASLRRLILPYSITTLGNEISKRAQPNVVVIIGDPINGSSLTTLDYNALSQKTIVLYAATPPTSWSNSGDILRVYVPDESISLYNTSYPGIISKTYRISAWAG